VEDQPGGHAGTQPLLGMPDGRESEILARFQRQLDEGADMQDLEYSGVENAGDTRYFRYMRAIEVKAHNALAAMARKTSSPRQSVNNLKRNIPGTRRWDTRQAICAAPFQSSRTWSTLQ